MRPGDLKTRIFLDGGDPDHTKALLDNLGFLDGQTTNPSLVAKNPDAKARMDAGEKFAPDELLELYKDIVQKAAGLIPHGSVSIEVYADDTTASEEMLAQARDMNGWIPNAHIKFPTTTAGLAAAERAVQEGIRVNMTLVFSQAQAAAVYAATHGSHKGDVFLSPFIGRLDDLGQNGMDLIANTLKMYSGGDGHVEVLTASVRSMAHFMESLRLGTDIITAPYAVLQDWAANGMPLPDADYAYDDSKLTTLQYQDLDMTKDWREYDIASPLTDKGQAKFAQDWNNLLK